MEHTHVVENYLSVKKGMVAMHKRIFIFTFSSKKKKCFYFLSLSLFFFLIFKLINASHLNHSE